MTRRTDKGAGAQRANVIADRIGFVHAQLAVDSYPKGSVTPVLVVPEALVMGCKHYEKRQVTKNPYHPDSTLEVCQDCGAHRIGERGRWQRPNILKVRSK